MDAEELAVVHYYTINAVQNLLQAVEDKIGIYKYYDGKASMNDLEFVAKELKEIIKNFKGQ